MNIWAMDKDVSIKHLLLLLEDVFGEATFGIVDSGSEDKRAVRLVNPAEAAVSIYLYTYGQKQGYYGVHIEYPKHEDINLSDTVEILDHVEFEAVVDLIRSNLGLMCSLVNRAEFC